MVGVGVRVRLVSFVSVLVLAVVGLSRVLVVLLKARER